MAAVAAVGVTEPKCMRPPWEGTAAPPGLLTLEGQSFQFPGDFLLNNGLPFFCVCQRESQKSYHIKYTDELLMGVTGERNA